MRPCGSQTGAVVVDLNREMALALRKGEVSRGQIEGRFCLPGLGGDVEAPGLQGHRSSLVLELERRGQALQPAYKPPPKDSVRAYYETWIMKRREADLDWKNDRSRMTHHVLPFIGDTALVDVRAKHVAELVHRWRFTTKLAQRTVNNVYSVVSALAELQPSRGPTGGHSPRAGVESIVASQALHRSLPRMKTVKKRVVLTSRVLSPVSPDTVRVLTYVRGGDSIGTARCKPVN
jgi:hypothetical protein